MMNSDSIQYVELSNRQKLFAIFSGILFLIALLAAWFVFKLPIIYLLSPVIGSYFLASKEDSLFIKAVSCVLVIVLYVTMLINFPHSYLVSERHTLTMFLPIMVFAFIAVRAVQDRQISLFAGSLFMVLFTIYGITMFIPKDTLVYEKDTQRVIYVDEMILVRPGYIDYELLREKIKMAGEITYTEGDNWLVEGVYELQEELRNIDSEGLTKLLSMQKNGIEIPSAFFSFDHNPKVAIETWFNETYPYFSFKNISVTYTARITWY